jgi:hypothetical protein
MSESIKSFPIKNYDLSQINSEQEFTILTSKNSNLISIHLDWEGLTGGLDASVEVIQKNDITLKWVELPDLSIIMDTASDSIILEDSEWGGEVLGIKVTMNSCTGGRLNCVVIGKNK